MIASSAKVVRRGFRRFLIIEVDGKVYSGIRCRAIASATIVGKISDHNRHVQICFRRSDKMVKIDCDDPDDLLSKVLRSLRWT